MIKAPIWDLRVFHHLQYSQRSRIALLRFNLNLIIEMQFRHGRERSHGGMRGLSPVVEFEDSTGRTAAPKFDPQERDLVLALFLTVSPIILREGRDRRNQPGSAQQE